MDPHLPFEILISYWFQVSDMYLKLYGCNLEEGPGCRRRAQSSQYRYDRWSYGIDTITWKG